MIANASQALNRVSSSALYEYDKTVVINELAYFKVLKNYGVKKYFFLS